MNEYYSFLIKKYQQKGLIIDTNILLLLVVGTTKKELITKFKRTQTFSSLDYDLLLQICASFTPAKIFTTPHILAEVANFVDQITEPDRSLAMKILANIVENLQEFYLESKKIVKEEPFNKFGLTDCAIWELSKQKYLVLTADFPLSKFLENQRIDVINFNNIRSFQRKD